MRSPNFLSLTRPVHSPYYVEQLSFELMFDHGEYILLRLDNAELHFFVILLWIRPSRIL